MVFAKSAEQEDYEKREKAMKKKEVSLQDRKDPVKKG
jgi:hypothetical protein